jgi:2-oxoglutarate ferredoxin oxidoreductase subunit gamma
VVEHADYFVAFSDSAYRKFYDLAKGLILYDPELVQNLRSDAPERHLPIPATQLAKQHFGNQLFANMIMLGALVRVAGLDPAVTRATLLRVLPRFHEQNLAAFDLGYTLDRAGAAAGPAPSMASSTLGGRDAASG